MLETGLTLVSLTALYFIFFINGKKIGYSQGWEDGYEDGKNFTYELLNMLDDDRLVYVVRSRKKDGERNDTK